MKKLVLIVVVLVIASGVGFGVYEYSILQANKNSVNTSSSERNQNKSKGINIPDSKGQQNNANDNNQIINENIEKAKEAIKNNQLEDANKYLDIVLNIDKENVEANQLKKEIQQQNPVDSNKTLTPEQAIQIVKKQFPQYASNANVHFNYDHDTTHDGKSFYVIQVFESMQDHSATYGWYGVDKTSGRIYDEILLQYIK